MAQVHCCILVSKDKGQEVRSKLEALGAFDQARKMSKLDGGKVEVPVKSKDHELIIKEVLKGVSWEWVERDIELSKPASQAEQIMAFVQKILKEDNLWQEGLIRQIPSHWEKHDDLAIFPINSFTSQIWHAKASRIWPGLAQILKVQRLAKKACISNDDFRSPNVELLLCKDENDVWATRRENGILYTWDITKSMFSVGNITEKQRIGRFDCQGQTVVDLFAGIGYFTLTYLVHAKANHVFACEWNPQAVEALKRNLAKNRVQHKCTVLQGDNREVCPQNVADHVNLGLIPSSSMAYQVACAALKQDIGGILHIHGNVLGDKSDWDKWSIDTQGEIQAILCPQWTTEILHLEPVKSYAPRVQHLVLDLKCSPSKCMSGFNPK